jgi:hypothetical protein
MKKKYQRLIDAVANFIYANERIGYVGSYQAQYKAMQRALGKVQPTQGSKAVYNPVYIEETFEQMVDRLATLKDAKADNIPVYRGNEVSRSERMTKEELKAEIKALKKKIKKQRK